MDLIYQYYRLMPGTLDEIEDMWEMAIRDKESQLRSAENRGRREGREEGRQQGAYMLLDLERRRLETLQTRIPNLVHRKLADARFSLLAAKKDLSQVTKALVARQSHRLELLQQRIADASPDKLLSRGYSITIKDGKAVTDASLLKPGEHLITRLSKGEVRSVVEK